MSRSRVRVALALLSCFALDAAVSRPARAAGKTVPVYACQGFDEPMSRANIHIGRGRVLPLRGKLVLPDGKFGDSSAIKAAPMLSLKYQPESGPEVDKTAGLEVRDYGKGRSFVFDKEAHWKFDLGTGNLKDDGKYVVSLVSGDPKEYRVDPACSLVFLLTP